jgi:transposase
VPAINASAFYEILQRLEYKRQRPGWRRVAINRFFLSCKMRTVCERLYPELTLSGRIFVRQRHGQVIDGELNAVFNVRQEARGTTGRSSGSHACGQENIGHQESAPLGGRALEKAGTTHRPGLP